MKHFYIIFLLTLTNAFSQDVIVMNDETKIEAKVKVITDTTLSYLRFDNLEGPIFIEKIASIKEIIFENGTSLTFSDKKNIEGMSLEETKEFIVQSINNYAFQRDGDKAYKASFDNQYLKLSRRDIETNEVLDNYRLFDFTAECEFHNLSKRGNDISYINVYVPRVFYGENRNSYKLVILVKSHEKGQLLLNALKHYNEFFQKN